MNVRSVAYVDKEPRLGIRRLGLGGLLRRATGFTIKKGQATNAVRSRCNDSIEAQIGQYFWLPTLFAAYKESDPAETYLLQSHPCAWDVSARQFHRAYIALSSAKHFWCHGGTSFIICDGTFTKTKGFRHILLIVVAFDGNNQLVILAFAIVDVENADNWIFFKESLEADFPGIKVWMSDTDKGIKSGAFALSMSQSEDEFILSRCAWHLTENCREAVKASMPQKAKDLIIELAKARTEDVYQRCLEQLRQLNDGWAQYMDGKKDEFASVSFLQRGHMRHGKVTSNGVETINGSLLEARGMPIVYMIESITQYQQEKYNERKVLAEVWLNSNKALTVYAEEQDALTGAKASKRTVQMLELIHPNYRAKVSVGNVHNVAGYIEVSVNVEDKSRACPCLYYEETGMNCVHVKALLLQLGSLGTGKDWWDGRFHLDNYRSSYGAVLPSLAVAGKLSADTTFLPPDYKRPAGRPKKKRQERSHYIAAKKRECKACGGEGHFAIACKQPSTEYQVTKHKEAAVSWCKKHETVVIEED